MNAVLYARYSSDNQREESITAQLRAGREYCNRKQYTIVGEYHDEAFSGTNDNRPSFQKMLADAKKKLFDVVIFHKIDRNARNEYDYYFNKMKLEKYGIRIEYAAQSIDATPEGALMENMLVGFAAYFSRNLAKEVRKGMHENAYQGLFNGGVSPLGYRIENKKYVIDEREAQAVKMIFKMYLAGQGYAAIIKELNSHGYRTRRGNTFEKTSLYDILANIRYTGTYVFGKNRNKTASGRRNQHAAPDKDCIFVENAIPAIISKEDFSQVAEIMKSNRRQAGKFTAKNEYLLSGLIYCGECGAAMQGTTTTSARNQTAHQYYRCGQRASKGSTACDNKLVSLPALEDLVIRKIDEVIFSPSSIEVLIDKIDAAYKKRLGDTTSERDELMKTKDKAMRRMKNIYNLVAEGIADRFDLDQLKEVKKEVLSLEEKLAELDVQSIPHLSRDQIIKVIEHFQGAIKSRSAENLRAIIQNFVNKIIVSKDEIVIEFKIKFDPSRGGQPIPENVQNHLSVEGSASPAPPAIARAYRYFADRLFLTFCTLFAPHCKQSFLNS